jgi:phosphatidylglycerol---prolipoprotein diacylglyceryl transferase
MRHRKYDGQIFWLFILLYSVARFFMDFLRGDSSDTFFGGLLFGVFTLAQGLCIAGFALSIIMLIFLLRRQHKTV